MLTNNSLLFLSIVLSQFKYLFFLEWSTQITKEKTFKHLLHLNIFNSYSHTYILQSVTAPTPFYSLSKSLVSVKCCLSITFHIALQFHSLANEYRRQLSSLPYFPCFPDFGNWIVARLPRQLYAAKFSAGRQIPQHLLYNIYSYKGDGRGGYGL